jgi:hypothetical protein
MCPVACYLQLAIGGLYGTGIVGLRSLGLPHKRSDEGMFAPLGERCQVMAINILCTWHPYYLGLQLRYTGIRPISTRIDLFLLATAHFQLTS